MRKKFKIDENELIVMKSGEVPVKTFTEVFEAVDWLKSICKLFKNYADYKEKRFSIWLEMGKVRKNKRARKVTWS